MLLQFVRNGSNAMVMSPNRENGGGFAASGAGRSVRDNHSVAEVAASRKSRAELIRRMMAFRRKRDQLFAPLGNGDASWIMLLELYLAEMEDRRESISSLCVASGAPSTTALRYIRSLTDAGLLVRSNDVHDRRRVFVGLSPDGLEHMHRLFDGFEQGSLIGY